MIIYYKNSFLASVCSISAGVVLLGGLAKLIDKEWLLGIVLLAGGIFLFWAAKQISDSKSFRQWWAVVKDKNLEPQIAASVEVAITIYNKNPQKRTIEAIRKLNPHAADVIEQQLAAKNSK